MTTKPYPLAEITGGPRGQVRLQTESGPICIDMGSPEAAIRITYAVNNYDGLSAALEASLLAMGRAGAKADTQHPQHEAWEGAYIALIRAGKLSRSSITGDL